MYSIRLFEESGGAVGMGWYVWVALLVFLVIIIIGWLASSQNWLPKKEEPIQAGHSAKSSHSVHH